LDDSLKKEIFDAAIGIPNQIDKLENCKNRAEKTFEVSEKFRHFYTHGRFFIFHSLTLLTLFIQESMSLLF